MQDHPDYNAERCHAFVCDVTDKQFVFPFPDESLDIIILVFCALSYSPRQVSKGQINTLIDPFNCKSE